MGFESAFTDLLASTITVSTRSSHNNYGEAGFSTSAATYAARIVQKAGFIRGPDGEDAQVTHVAWVRSTAAAKIALTDRVTFPSSVALDTTPELMLIERFPDEDGIHHSKLTFGHSAPRR